MTLEERWLLYLSYHLTSGDGDGEGVPAEDVATLRAVFMAGNFDGLRTVVARIEKPVRAEQVMSVLFDHYQEAKREVDPLA